jgi:hypothetical protein
MTVSVVQQAVPTVAGVVGTSCSVTLSSPPTVGNQLALWLASGKPGTDFPTNLSAWTLIGNVSPFTSAGIWLYTKTSDGSETTTSVTFNLSAAHNIAIQEWPAAAQFGTISDGYLSGLTSSASLGPTDAPPAGGGTPSMFVFDTSAGDTAFAFPAGWTQAGPYPTAGFPYYSDIVAAGTTTQTSAVTAVCTKGTRAPSLVWTNVWVYATGGGTTVALTGEAETSAAGTVAPSQSSSLTGQGATGAQGSFTAGVSIALAGQAATASRGSIAASATAVLAGQTSSFAQGTLTAVGAGTTIALMGKSAGFGHGQMSPAMQVSMTGLLATTGFGALTVPSGNVSIAMTGLSVTYTHGVLAPYYFYGHLCGTASQCMYCDIWRRVGKPCWRFVFH